MCRGVALCLLGLLMLSAVADAQQQYGFRISFTDKSATTYSLSNPSAYLSQRAIDRRNTQNIAIDSTDLPVVQEYVDTVLDSTGGKFHLVSRWFNYMVVLLDDSSKILNIQGKPWIKDIKYIAYYPGGLHKPAHSTSTTGNSTGFQPPMKVTGSSLYYGDAYNQTAIVLGDYLHGLGWKGQGKLIAVLDEGFANVNSGPAFDSMINGGRLVDHYNYTDAVSNVFTNRMHGTTSLSTMAANIPGTYVGSAPLASYALYITEVQGSEQELEMDNMVAASERADSIGADIITISLGYNEFNLPVYHTLNYAQDMDGKTTIAARGANMATTKGILFVASAGNEGGGTWNYILTPGDADSAITIGSVGLDRVPAPNSSFGPNAAGQVKPDVCMVGQLASVLTSGSNPFLSSGTSWATPQLAGWAACLMQASGNYSPYQLRTAIQKSAHIYNRPDDHLGYGVPNFQYALQLLDVPRLPKVPDEQDWLTVGPNPFDKQLTLRMYSRTGGPADILLTDVSGKKIYRTTEQTGIGIQTVTIDMPDIPRGVYFLQATAGDNHAQVKVVKY